jgi:hypothetical protein
VYQLSDSGIRGRVRSGSLLLSVTVVMLLGRQPVVCPLSVAPQTCVWRCTVWVATATRPAFSWFTDWGLRRGAPCNRPPLAAPRHSLKLLRWGSEVFPTESSPSTALAAC